VRMAWIARRLLVLVGVAVSFPNHALAWGDVGHQLVARIAARRLSADARRRVAELVRQAADDDLGLKGIVGTSGVPSRPDIERVLVRMATWPDHMPGGKGATSPWHFVDFPLFEGPVNQHCEKGCVTDKIPTMIAKIKSHQKIDVIEADGTVRTFEPDRELRFLVHFFGDIHQPLHAATNADAGGNCIHAHGFTGPMNLHHVWDTPLVMEAIADSAAITHPNDPTRDILTEFQSEAATAAMETDPRAIATDSFNLAKTEVYARTKPVAAPIESVFVDLRPDECSTRAPADILALDVDAPASYNNVAARKLVRERLFKAGIRLRAVLQQL
jgi:nuclease S1